MKSITVTMEGNEMSFRAGTWLPWKVAVAAGYSEVVIRCLISWLAKCTGEKASSWHGGHQVAVHWDQP